MRRIVVCGHICLDIIPTFPPVAGQDYFRPGRLTIVDAAVTATGGTVSNVGLSLHKLGVPVRLVAKVGKDPFGDIVTRKMAATAADLANGITAVEGETTSYSVVINPPGIDRVFFHCPGANDTFTDADVPDGVFKDASIFHFGYPPLMKRIWSDGGDSLLRLLRRAKAGGLVTSLDMSLPDPGSASGMIDWGSFLAHVLPAVDIFVPSIEEFLFMGNRPLFDKLSAGQGRRRRCPGHHPAGCGASRRAGAFRRGLRGPHQDGGPRRLPEDRPEGAGRPFPLVGPRALHSRVPGALGGRNDRRGRCDHCPGFSLPFPRPSVRMTPSRLPLPWGLAAWKPRTPPRGSGRGGKRKKGCAMDGSAPVPRLPNQAGSGWSQASGQARRTRKPEQSSWLRAQLDSMYGAYDPESNTVFPTS